jgi:hypothetical protein
MNIISNHKLRLSDNISDQHLSYDNSSLGGRIPSEIQDGAVRLLSIATRWRNQNREKDMKSKETEKEEEKKGAKGGKEVEGEEDEEGDENNNKDDNELNEESQTRLNGARNEKKTNISIQRKRTDIK